MKIFKIQLMDEGTQVVLDGKDTFLIVRNHGNPTNEFKEERYIISGKDVLINKGSIIKYDNDFYIVITDIDKENPAYNTSKMQKSNYMLKWVDQQGKIQSSPAIVANKTLYTAGVYEDTLIRVQNMTESILLPFNNITKYIDIDDRFQINRNFWRITKIDEDRQGLIDIMCEQDNYNPDTDNKDLKIADYYNRIHTYRLEILNETPILCSLSEPVPIQLNAYDNDILVKNPDIIFEIQDETICRIENNQIIPIQSGITNIIVRYENIKQIININISDKVVDNYIIDIQGSEFIKWGRQSEYQVFFKLNGVEYTNFCKFKLTDENGNTTDLATILEQDDTNNTCIIQANKNMQVGEVFLCCFNDTGLTKVKKIQIKSIYG